MFNHSETVRVDLGMALIHLDLDEKLSVLEVGSLPADIGFKITKYLTKNIWSNIGTVSKVDCSLLKQPAPGGRLDETELDGSVSLLELESVRRYICFIYISHMKSVYGDADLFGGTYEIGQLRSIFWISAFTLFDFCHFYVDAGLFGGTYEIRHLLNFLLPISLSDFFLF